MNSLVAAQSQIEVAAEVSLGDTELNAVNRTALVFSSTVNGQAQLFAVLVREVLQHVASDIAGVEHTDSSAIGICALSKGQSLRFRIIGKLTFTLSGLLFELRLWKVF